MNIRLKSLIFSFINMFILFVIGSLGFFYSVVNLIFVSIFGFYFLIFVQVCLIKLEWSKHKIYSLYRFFSAIINFGFVTTYRSFSLTANNTIIETEFR